MKTARILFSVALTISLSLPVAYADEQAVDAVQPSQTIFNAVLESAGRIESLLHGALDLVGIRYRRGGSSVETGFDCSGFVGHVFREHLGLFLPRTSYEIAREGASVSQAELKPGDLVFFNTMRRTFSHVGIYLGDNRFVHAPRPGRAVRVEDMRESYWTRRFNGARRVSTQ